MVYVGDSRGKIFGDLFAIQSIGVIQEGRLLGRSRHGHHDPSLLGG